SEADRLVTFGWTFGFGGPDSEVLLVSRGYRERLKPALDPFTAVTTIVNAVDTCDVTEQRPERLSCIRVESNFLQTMGVRPALGHDFKPEEDIRGVPPVAIISHEVWARRFGADPNAMGRRIDINGKPI